MKDYAYLARHKFDWNDWLTERLAEIGSAVIVVAVLWGVGLI